MAKKTGTILSTSEDDKYSSESKTEPTILSENDAKKFILDNINEQIRKEIATDKASLFTVFGVFASIVTFLSVEIQILMRFDDPWNSSGFSLIILASLLIFITLLDYIGRGWRDDSTQQLKNFPWVLFAITTLIFLTGLFLTSRGNEQKSKENLIYMRYEKDFTERQVELERMFDDEIKTLRSAIHNTSAQVKGLQEASPESKEPHEINSNGE